MMYTGTNITAHLRSSAAPIRFSRTHGHIKNRIADVVTTLARKETSSLSLLAMSCFKEVNFKL